MTNETIRVEEALRELQQGRMVILTDDPDRENEGDLIFPAEVVTAEITQFMIRHCSGIICLSMLASQLEKLNIPLMFPPSQNTSRGGTPFTVTIEARNGVSTGVSAADRATTIRAAANANAKPEDLVRPGHVFPLQAKSGGVLERAGHTEGSIELMRLAGFAPAAVLCEIMNPDGTMARGKQLQEFAETHQLKVLAIEDLITYRLSRECMIEEETSTVLPLENYGLFNLSVIKEKYSGKEHVVLTHEKNKGQKNPLVRIHSACMTGDLFGSQRCDCHRQLQYSLSRISEEGGILIYLNQEGRGIGLLNKIKAYALQEGGMDTVEANEHLGLPADMRKYYMAANILRSRGIESIRLLSNNPHKVTDLQKYGIDNVERIAMPQFKNAHNELYLHAKQTKLKHLIFDEALTTKAGSWS